MVALLEKRHFRDFDWLLTLLATGIVLFGTWQIHNAQPTENFWKKQLIGLAVSLAALFAIAFTDYRKLLHIAPAFYIVGLILLIVVLVPGIGMKINGQRCWIRTPGIAGVRRSSSPPITDGATHRPTGAITARKYQGRKISGWRLSGRRGRGAASGATASRSTRIR